ncbi:DUF5691 domain-containing protein [Haloferula sp.]|uniref:DUF5691 domain-containing protein n=1 Tax=Haloferula sp. TaxID=2497595 RepID=UPI003C74B9E5
MSEDPLIATSLLGAARLKELPPAPDLTWQTTWDAIPMDDPAAGLLQALALSRAARLAGKKTVEAGGVAEPCKPESCEELGEVAVAALLRMLGGEFREVLPEWLDSNESTGCVVPARVLPELLEAGRRDRSLRASLAGLVGERGRWMAQRHEKYAWVLDRTAGGEADWDGDHDSDRLEWLRQTRHQDPGKAVAALSEGWAGESPDFRQSVVQLAANEALACDESWLENLGLKDRRQETRRLAAAALMQLRDSAFAIRNRERLRQIVRIGGVLRKKIEVEPPTAFDECWAADGLREKPPAGTGEKAWWLQQIVGMVPLSEWLVMLEVTEKELFKITIEPDWKDDIVLGWIESAKNLPAHSLPSGLLVFLAELKVWPAKAGSRPQVLASLLAAAPDPDPLLEDLAKRLPEAEMIQLLTSHRRAPRSSKSLVIAVIRKTLWRTPVTITRPDGRLLALCVPLTSIQGELEWLSRLKELSAPAEEFATTLEFRRNLFTTTTKES